MQVFEMNALGLELGSGLGLGLVLGLGFRFTGHLLIEARCVSGHAHRVVHTLWQRGEGGKSEGRQINCNEHGWSHNINAVWILIICLWRE